MIRWLKNVLLGELIVLDEAGNVLFMHGDDRITISAHCGFLFSVGKSCWICSIARFMIEGMLARVWPSLHGHFARAWETEKPIWLLTRNLPGGGYR